MDLSKLPKLSQTPTPSGNPPAPADLPSSPDPYVTSPPSSAADAWLSIAVGVILLLICPRLIQYVLSPSTFDQKWTFTDETGAPLPYIHSLFFYGDLAVILFAFVLIIDGIVLLVARRAGMILSALIFTAVATLVNLLYVIVMLAKGYGPQIYSLLAVAFGVYIAIGQSTLLKRIRA